MRMRPESLAELVRNLRWATGSPPCNSWRTLCRGPQDFGAGAPGMKEAMGAHITGPWSGGIRKPRMRPLWTRTRAEQWDLWQGYPARRLLTDLYQRAARRQDGSGSANSRRLPD